jgi:hypothetical protein
MLFREITIAIEENGGQQRSDNNIKQTGNIEESAEK